MRLHVWMGIDRLVGDTAPLNLVYCFSHSQCEGWLKRASRFLGKDRFHEGSTESISTAISELDAVQQEEPVSTVNSLKQIATCLTDKTCRKGANKVINKCQKVSMISQYHVLCAVCTVCSVCTVRTVCSVCTVCTV